MGVTDYFDTRCGTVVFAVAVTVVCACMILAVICPTAATRSLYTGTGAGGKLIVLTLFDDIDCKGSSLKDD